MAHLLYHWRGSPYAEDRKYGPLNFYLCPNHHLLFDQGGIMIGDDMAVIDRTTGLRVGKLSIEPRHAVRSDHLRYHRQRFGR